MFFRSKEGSSLSYHVQKNLGKSKIIGLCILLTLLIATLIFCSNNDRFYHRTIAKVVKVDNSFDSSMEGPNKEIEKYYKQKISAIVRNGEYKGEAIILENIFAYSGIKSEEYRVGDRIFVNLQSNEGILSGTITGVKRDTYIALLLGVFMMGLLLVAPKKGFLTVVSVVINLAVFITCINIYGKNEDFSQLWVYMVVAFCSVTLLLVSGLRRKTLGAIVSSFITVFVIWGLYSLLSRFTEKPPYEMMEYITGPEYLGDIFMASVIVGSLGAIMDVAITINSTVNELISTAESITIKELVASIREIGLDIMGTMINVLFFSYMSGALPQVILEFKNGYSLYSIANFSIYFEVIRFLLGSIGIVLAIPISGIIAVLIFRRGVWKKSC